METKIFLEGTKELTKEETQLVNGGGFAYDLGFFVRELFISVANGGGAPGNVAVAVDLGLNYKPVR